MPFITRAFAKDVRLLYQSFTLDMILLKFIGYTRHEFSGDIYRFKDISPSKEVSFTSITSLTMSFIKRF